MVHVGAWPGSRAAIAVGLGPHVFAIPFTGTAAVGVLVQRTPAVEQDHRFRIGRILIGVAQGTPDLVIRQRGAVGDDLVQRILELVAGQSFSIGVIIRRLVV